MFYSWIIIGLLYYQLVKIRTLKIGILGSGFGSMHTALHLAKLRKKLPKNIKLHVTIISDTDYFWLVTMAHEIATGGLVPSDVMQPLRSLGVEVFDDYIQAKVTEIDVFENQVKYELLETVSDNLKVNKKAKFDYLISALGSEVNFFGTKGASKYAFPIKTLTDVKSIKNQILQVFEDAERISDETEMKKLLSFVIVGGGATGVELAAEIGDMIQNSLKKRFPNVVKFSRVILVSGGKKIGIPGKDWMTAKLEKALKQTECVDITCGNYVDEVTSDGAIVAGKLLPSKTVIWAGGVKASTVKFVDNNQQPIEPEKGGRISVELDLSFKSNRSVFVIGDQSYLLDSNGDPYPMRAQFAVRQGELVASNIIADQLKLRRKKFNYQDKGVILSLGRGKGVAEIYGKKFSGPIVHFLYRMVYIPQLIGVRAKVRTLVDFILDIFTDRDLSKL